MIISDLNYLEVASEAFSVVGGGKKHKKHDNKKKEDPKDKKNEYSKTVNVIVQVANVKSIAKTYKGDATSAVEVNQAAAIG